MTFFVIPLITEVVRGESKRWEKYVPALGVDRSVCDIGDTGIVCAVTTPAQDAAIAANADVIQIPPLDNTVAVTATRNALEGLDIPGDWIQAGMTYRQVLRVIIGMAQFIQLSESLGAKVVLKGNLDLTMAQIPIAQRNALSAAADQLGIDRSAVTGSTTVRQALHLLGSQFANSKTIRMGSL
jgi:hypothetical protein